MKNYETFRIKLGLTQSEMANYLKINRSQLNIFEQGQYELPKQVFLKLSEMKLFLVNFEAQPT